MVFTIPVILFVLIALFMSLLFLISRVTDFPLPHVEIESVGEARGVAIVLSGSGGWIRFDQRLADGLAQSGFRVLGIDSLRYFFWKRRKPAALAEDLSKLIRDFSQETKDIVLIGYAKGADVLPFAVNLLSSELRGRVRLIALLGVARLAVFHLGLFDLLSGGRKGLYPLQVSPEIKKMEGLPGLCIYGDKDRVSLCRNLKRVSSVEVQEIPSGPIFHDADLIIRSIQRKLQTQIFHSQDMPQDLIESPDERKAQRPGFQKFKGQHP